MTTLTFHVSRSIAATLRAPGTRSSSPPSTTRRTSRRGERSPRTAASWSARSTSTRRTAPSTSTSSRRSPRATDPARRRSATPRTPLGTINPVAEIVRAGPRGRGAHLRRRRALRPARPDRRARHRHRLPGLLGLQVVRAAPRGALREGRRAGPPARLQGPPGPRPLRDRDALLRGVRRDARRRRLPPGARPDVRRGRGRSRLRRARRASSWPRCGAIAAYERPARQPDAGRPPRHPGRARLGDRGPDPHRRAHADVRRHVRGGRRQRTAADASSGGRASSPGTATSTRAALIERLGLADVGGVLRLGLVHYSTADEVDRTLETLAGIAAAAHGGPRPLAR